MTKIEALELELAARKMVEGTELGWWDVIKVRGVLMPMTLPIFNRDKEDYELALGVIEGKPVFEGDELYRSDGHKFTACAYEMGRSDHSTMSWNPPLKTVMVEMLVEDVKSWVEFEDECRTHLSVRTSLACRKALERS